jgi:hypothetical protein
MKYRVIVFRNGKRVEKVITHDQLPAAKEKVRELREQGHKASIALCLVKRDNPSTYPPPESIQGMRNEGYLWCPYCRAWRYFKIPRANENAAVGSLDWMVNTYRNQEIKICSWCHISERDFWVLRVNQTWEQLGEVKRHRKRRVRQRVGRA